MTLFCWEIYTLNLHYKTVKMVGEITSNCKSISILSLLITLSALSVLESTAQDCQSTSWYNVSCPDGYREVYRDVDDRSNVNKYCCIPGTEGEEVAESTATNCQATSCVPSSFDDPCSTIPSRFVGENKLEYEIVSRDSCSDSYVQEGVTAVCCVRNSTQAMLVSTTGAEPHEFPHIAKLTAGNHLCGGTIYNKRFIITAGHCIWDNELEQLRNASSMSVVVGTNDREVNTDEYVYQVKRIIPHDNFTGLSNTPFSPGKADNDIALLELERDIKFGDTVKSLEIAPHEFDALLYAQYAVFAGWGLTITMDVPVTLRKGNAILWTDDQCFSPEGSWAGNAEGVRDTMMCVGGMMYGKKSPGTPSQGDSGGPIICRGEDGHPVLCGVVSYGADDAQCWKNQDEASCKPTVITEVSHYHDWIRLKAGDQNPEELYKPYLLGKRVAKGEYEHQVHITSTTGKSCGGTLVAPDIVVTAAQCAVSSDGSAFPDLKVTTNLNNLETDKGETYEVKRVTAHPGFQEIPLSDNPLTDDGVMSEISYFKNDLAIIKLNGPTSISPDKLPILIPENQENKHTHGLELAFTKNSSTPSSQFMSRLFQLLNLTDCQTRMDRLSNVNLNVKVDENLICGVEVYSGGSTCDREFGGGLICSNGQKEVLCGVQTFRLCKFALPNAFVNLSRYSGWLKEEMQKP